MWVQAPPLANKEKLAFAKEIFPLSHFGIVA